MKLNLENIYKKNKEIWDKNVRRGRNIKLHYIWGRSVPIYKVCPLCWVDISKPEHNDWRVLKGLRTDFDYVKKYVDLNYKRDRGCLKTNLMICNENCKMPKVEDV